jgi:hypothetical protein
MTADYLLSKIREQGGRPYRMRGERAFVLTGDEKLAARLVDLGGQAHSPQGAELPDGGYRRTRKGPIEWDVWIHTIPVSGPSIWEALG